MTPIELIDRAIYIARQPNVILTSFGDMLRVPGSRDDLLRAKSAGADVRMVYSPLDAVTLAQKHPEKHIVFFFAVGFETTAPPNAMAVVQAHRLKLDNFSILASHVLVLLAIRALLNAPDNVVQGFLAAGLRVHDHGDQGIRTACQRIPATDRRDGFRAAGPAAGDLSRRHGPRRGALGSRESIRAQRDTGWKRNGAATMA